MATTVKRLRIAARHDESQGRMMNEAADLIEQQQREIERQIELRKYAVEQLDNERKTTTKLAARIDELLFENSALNRELRKSATTIRMVRDD